MTYSAELMLDGGFQLGNCFRTMFYLQTVKPPFMQVLLLSIILPSIQLSPHRLEDLIEQSFGKVKIVTHQY